MVGIQSNWQIDMAKVEKY